MRDEGMVRFRRWSGSRDSSVLLVDVRAMPCTDVGFLEAWLPDRDEPWRTLLRFDEVGDISYIDWDAVLKDPAPLKRLVRGRVVHEVYKKYRYGFWANCTDRLGHLVWHHARSSELSARWASIRDGSSSEEEED